jgi:anti-anti-sigma regulatory factor
VTNQFIDLDQLRTGPNQTTHRHADLAGAWRRSTRRTIIHSCSGIVRETPGILEVLRSGRRHRDDADMGSRPSELLLEVNADHRHAGELPMNVDYIRVSERLDIAKVDSIEASLRLRDPERHVVLDFQEVRSFEEAALRRLAQHLSQAKRPVVLRGLSEQHYRLLRYVGLPQHVNSDEAARVDWRR